MMDDLYYMKRALRLARKGEGRTSPNPMVGAVIVKDGIIVGEGYHKRFGDKHAEVVALEMAGEKAKGSTMYVNLEPCSHYGKTPPCADAILKAGVKKVCFSMIDPNPMVSGKGAGRLLKGGVELSIGLLEKEAVYLNAPFVFIHTLKRPFVNLKIASTMDGRIATHTGDSRWITSYPSRKLVHRWRSVYDAVLVGIGTILMDDPMLNVRFVKGRDPMVVVLDKDLRIPWNSKVLANKNVVIFTSHKGEKGKELERMGKKVIEVGACGSFLDLREVLQRLMEMGVSSVLVEGGGKVFTSFIECGLADKITLFLSPKMIGGPKTFLSSPGVERIKDAYTLKNVNFKKVGDDILIEGFINDPYEVYKNVHRAD